MKFNTVRKREGMKAFLYTACLVFAGMFLSAQSYNPYVKHGSVKPSPMLPAEFNGDGILSFDVGNSGSTPLHLVANQEMTLFVTLSDGIPAGKNPLEALGGSWMEYFNWSYDRIYNTFKGVQNRDIPGELFGNITIKYQVTKNSSETASANGCNVNLQPPPYSNGFNDTEDDALSLYGYVKAFDFGDAPESYGIAKFEIKLNKNMEGRYTDFIFLGTSVDADSENLPSMEANRDDLSGTDDEDGVVFPTLVQGDTVKIQVFVTTKDESFGFLNGWIDWNGDGDFTDWGEKITPVPVPVFSSDTFDIEVAIPDNAISGIATFARFTVGNNLNAPGNINWGEVEDYRINIERKISNAGMLESGNRHPAAIQNK
jgi:hypothetical protein